MWKSLGLALAAFGLALSATTPAMAWRSGVSVHFWGGPVYPYYGPPVYYAPPVVVYPAPPPPPPVIVYRAPPVVVPSAPVVEAAPAGPVYRDATSGLYCREYQSTVIIGGQRQASYGTACQQPDGTWRIVQ